MHPDQILDDPASAVFSLGNSVGQTALVRAQSPEEAREVLKALFPYKMWTGVPRALGQSYEQLLGDALGRRVFTAADIKGQAAFKTRMRSPDRRDRWDGGKG